MAKYVLENNFEFEFKLFSIVCHESEYRLCSAINKNLGLDLAREKNLELKNKKQQDVLQFSVFSYTDEENQLEYILLNNLSSNASRTEEKGKVSQQAGLFDEVAEEVNHKKGRLIPEKEDADYLLMVNGEISSAEKSNLQKKLSALEMVLNISELEVEKLPSRNNLLF